MKLDTDNWDPRTKPGILGKVAKAKEEVEELKILMTNQILNNSTTVLVLRDVTITPDIVAEARKFPENIIVLDFLGLEKGMFNKIYGKSAKTFSFNTDTISRMNSLMIDVADKLQFVSMPTITANGNLYSTSSNAVDVVNKMETVLTGTYDTELKQIFLNHAILDNMDNKFNHDSVAVFIVNVPPTPKFLKALGSYTSRTITVTENSAMPGAVVLEPESSAAELVSAVAQVTESVEPKKARRPNRAKVTNEEPA